MPFPRPTQAVFAVVSAFAALGAMLGGCGVVGIGGGTGLNDPAPSGTIVAQGSFAGQNGKAVSGTVSVYKTSCDASTCVFVVRLQNLSAPQESNLQLVATINGAVVANHPVLRASTGTQNYAYSGLFASVVWNQVAIHPGALPVGNSDYGLATLQAVASP